MAESRCEMMALSLVASFLRPYFEEIFEAEDTCERLDLLINSEGLSVEGAKSPLRSPKTASPSDSSGKPLCRGPRCSETKEKERHDASTCPKYRRSP